MLSQSRHQLDIVEPEEPYTSEELLSGCCHNTLPTVDGRPAEKSTLWRPEVGALDYNNNNNNNNNNNSKNNNNNNNNIH